MLLISVINTVFYFLSILFEYPLPQMRLIVRATIRVNHAQVRFMAPVGTVSSGFVVARDSGMGSPASSWVTPWLSVDSRPMIGAPIPSVLSAACNVKVVLINSSA